VSVPGAGLLRRIAFLLRRGRAVRELDEEMQLHLELRERQLREQGMAPAEAARAARLRFGNRTNLNERSQDTWGWGWLDGLAGDMRRAGRLLRTRPLFAAAVVITLAVGIGPNVATFSVMNAVMLRHLPVPEPDRLVHVHTSDTPQGANNTGNDTTSFSYAVFDHLRGQRDALSDVMAYAPLAIAKTPVRLGPMPEGAEVVMVSGNFFTGLRVGATCGRLLTAEDEATRAPVTVVSHAFWARRLGGDCRAVGSTLRIKGVPFTVVGVAAPGFTGGGRSMNTDLWVPLQARLDFNAWGMQRDLSFLHDSEWWCLLLVARLAPGITEQAALARLQPGFMQVAYQGLKPPAPGERRVELSFATTRGMSDLRDSYADALVVLQVMVVVVLVIACVNVALLILARNETRRREFALRLALGCGRRQLLRQLLAESLLLVLGASVLGWLLAVAATNALGAWSGLEVDLAPDRRVLLFALGLAALATLVFAVAPLGGATSSPIAGLRLTGATGQAQRAWARRTLVAAQVGLCLALLVGAGLLGRTLRNLERIPLGMRAPMHQLLVFGLSPQQRTQSRDEIALFYQTLLGRLRALPGVEAATLMENRIGSGWSNNTSVRIDGKRPQVEGSPSVRWNVVASDYFRTLGIPMLNGRELRDGDGPRGPFVAVVNQTFVTRYLGGGNALGHEIAMTATGDARRYQIVGVAADSKYTGVREPPTPTAYFPFTQLGHISAMHVELRFAGAADVMLPAVQRAVRELAPELPLEQPRTQREEFARNLGDGRLFARFATCFGLLAIMLVATGLYGTLAYAVNRRTTEIGVRMALGAQRGHVLWMVLRESLLVCAAGVAVGLPLALAGARALASLLYGISPGDPVTVAAALGGLALVALAASLLPARRATAVHPMAALRSE
jgi:predicted permease